MAYKLELPEMDERHRNAASSYQVVRWPEFLAFAERLGIDLTKPIMKLNIELDMNSCAVVTVTLRGSDTTPTPIAVDTTTFHNDKYASFMSTKDG